MALSAPIDSTGLAPAEPEPAPPARSARGLIFTIIFLDLLGVGLIAPLMPFVVDKFKDEGAFYATGTAVTLLTMAYSAAQFLATPVLGALSDRVGRRPVLIYSLLGSAVGYVIFATAGAYWLLLLSRVLDGVSGGNISTAQAYIADITPAKDRAKAFGFVGAAFGLGFTLGPAAGAALAYVHPMAPVWAAAALSLVTMTLVQFKLPESLPRSKRVAGPVVVSELNPVGALLRVLAFGSLAGLLSIIFMVNFAHAEMRSTFSLFIRDVLGLDQQHASAMFAYVGLMAIVVQGFLVRALVPRLGDKQTAMIGLPVGALGYVLMGFSVHWTQMLGAITLMALGGGLAGPTITSMLSRRVSEQQQGAVMGASASVAALALVLGPIAAGALYDHVGHCWPFWTGALVVLFGWLLLVGVASKPAIPAAH